MRPTLMDRRPRPRRAVRPGTVIVVAAAACALAKTGRSQPPGEPTTQPSRTANEDLVRKLLGGESTETSDIDRTLERMKDAADRLSERYDTGEATRAVQHEIIDGIDRLIEQARKAGSSGGGSSPGRRSVRPQGRRGPDRTSRPSAPDQKRSAAAGNQPGGPADAPEAGRRRTTKAELSRGWGFLPPRVRDEIVQGFDEEFHARYREQIMRYYRELAREAEDK